MDPALKLDVPVLVENGKATFKWLHGPDGKTDWWQFSVQQQASVRILCASKADKPQKTLFYYVLKEILNPDDAITVPVMHHNQRLPFVRFSESGERLAQLSVRL